MYRIKSPTGDESVYRTPEELAASIASGILGPSCEVFHNPTGRWLPVEAHPEVKALLLSRSATKPEIDLVPIPLPSGPSPGSLDASPHPIEPEAPSEPASPPVMPQLRHPLGDSRARKLRVMLALAGGLAALTIVGLAARLTGHGDRDRAAGMAPPGAWNDSAYFPEALSPAGEGEMQRLDSAVNSLTRPPSAVSSHPLLRHPLSYAEAYAGARAEMENGLSYLRARDLLAGSRFLSPGSARQSRRLVASVGNVFRAYRTQEVLIEQASELTANSSQRESFAASEATRTLLADAESLFAIVAEAGEGARSTPAGLRFTEPADGARYARIRADYVATASLWRDSLAGPRLVTVPRVLRVLGPLPPPTRR